MIVAILFILLIISFGIAARLGHLKRMFITKGVPGIYPRHSVYALVPFGIAFSVAILFRYTFGPNWSDNLIYLTIFLGLGGLGFITLIWQPRWLKPAWLQWMEDHYEHVLEEMFAEVWQMGAHNWEAQVRTQADLEKWADSVAQRHGWRRLS